MGFKQLKKSLYLETFLVYFNLLQKRIMLLPLLKKDEIYYKKGTKQLVLVSMISQFCISCICCIL